MKTLGILATLPLLFAGAAPSHGSAAPPMCLGKPATVVGDPDRPREAVDGTEGDDVIVSNGQQFVLGYGGDDTICIKGERTTRVGAEDGDDVVDASALAISAKAWVALGRGDDTFLGHRGVDQIYTDRNWSHATVVDVGTDVISTGGGADLVETGAAGYPDEDTIATGGGNDVISKYGTATGPIAISGGTGRDEVRWMYSERPQQWSFDNQRGEATASGAPVAEWTGLEVFDLVSLANHELTFMGSDKDEAVRAGAHHGAKGGTIQAAMRGGDDEIWVRASQHLDLNGGPGRDALTYRGSRPHDPAVLMDLRAGSVTREGAVVARTAAFEDAVLGAPPGSRLVGTGGRNELVLQSCRGRIDGLGGDDRLITSTKGSKCRGPVEGAQLYGGPGADRLVGGIYRDRLYDGPGTDAADGGPDRDLCRAERRTGCER